MGQDVVILSRRAQRTVSKDARPYSPGADFGIATVWSPRRVAQGAWQMAQIPFPDRQP
jgi:hypothetical protein